MHRWLFLLVAGGVATLPGLRSYAATVPEHDPHTLIVKFSPAVDGKALAAAVRANKSAIPTELAALRQAGIEALEPVFPIPPRGLKKPQIYDSLALAQYFLGNLPAGADAVTVCNNLVSNPTVAIAEPNWVNRLTGEEAVPNDDLYAAFQWDLVKMGLPAAWDITKGSNSILIGMVDSGIDILHPDLTAHVAVNTVEMTGFIGVDDDANGFTDDYYGWDFISNDGNPDDGSTHGTHVAGTIGAVTNNSIGVAGVNWNVALLSAKVFDASGNGGTDLRIASAVQYLVDNGCWAINMSLGGPASALKAAAVNYAYSYGVAVIASSGNENSGIPSYPAGYSTVLAVGATNSADQRWVWSDTSGSNFGLNLDVVAPGEQIASTMPRSYNPAFPYEFKTGTSMAAPHVTGLAALILSVRPTLSVDSLYWYIEVGAMDMRGDPSEDKPGWDQYFGWGRVNAYNSIRLALGQCACKCQYDPRCDGIVSDVLDVSDTINRAFRGSGPSRDYGCPYERTDVDASGDTDVLDVTKVINVAFRGASAASQYDLDHCH